VWAELGTRVAFGTNRGRLEKLEHQVRELCGIVDHHGTRLDNHDVRLSELKSVHSTLDEFSGYRDMTRDELLRVQGALDIHEQTLESLIEWAETEDYRERVMRLRYRFRHHQTRSKNALAALDG
jgi:methyl coenzyme M reductase gamma subunit